MGVEWTNRERMAAALAGEFLDVVPSWTMSFFNADTMRRLVPADCLVRDLGMWPEEDAYGFAAHSSADLERIIRLNRYIDRVAIGVGRGANHAFGHAGPGEFNSWVIEKTGERSIVEYETGARALIQHKPHFYHMFRFPVESFEDLDRLALPDPRDPTRWDGFAEDVKRLKERGEYTVGWVNGFFSGCHYFFCEYQDLLAALAQDLDFVERLVGILGTWNLRAAEAMLQTGVDCIGFVDDLGSERNLLFRPALYERLFLPWHARLCSLAHRYGARVHMHSHGNIMRILDRLVETGIDMLNPLDPTEGMDLATIKARYGRELTLVGGMDKFIFEQQPAEIERRLRASLELGAAGGRFILMDTGGIPETISEPDFRSFLALSRRLREETAKSVRRG